MKSKEITARVKHVPSILLNFFLCTLKKVYQHIHKTSTNKRLSLIFLTVSTKRYVIVLCNMGLKC